MSNYSFILSNYIKPDFIYTNDSSCNCSLIDDKILLSCWRNFTFINFYFRKKYEKDIGRHIWFNNTLWSDSKLYNINENNTNFIKFLTKTTDHNLKSCGCEDFRVIEWQNKNYALYSKIEVPFSVYKEHFCEIDENLNIKNDKEFKTNNRIEKNWQPIEIYPFECVYSYKPFKTINLKTNQFKEYKNNICNDNYRGSSQVISYKDKLICIVHKRNETDKYHYYTHYFAIFDKQMNLLKITKPFSFTGADIEFCTFMKRINGKITILMSVYDQLTFKFEIEDDLIDSIIDDKLNNSSINKNLHDDLYKLAKENKNYTTAICMATFSTNKNLIEDAIKLNYSSTISKDKKIILQKILIEKYKG